MDLELAGKAVVVTGGASGVGRACAEAFAREGARVAILDCDAEQLAATRDALAATGAEVLALKTDVARSDEVDAAHNEVIERFGGIDVAFNNAGVISPMSPIADVSEEDWDRVLGVNLKGVFLCIRAQVRHMQAGGNGGAIVVNTSNTAFAGVQGAAAYVAAKHGLIGLMRCAALELAGSGIRVNCIAPGPLSTIAARPRAPDAARPADPFPDAMIRRGLPIGRLGRPEEIADAVLWLASPRASLVVGETLVADGGFLAQ